MVDYSESGLMDEGGTVDPVSGNEVPPGALQQEVRDDVEARLSEGEFVFPADVVRYIGLEKLMKMRQVAKQGLSQMEDMGQMGNAEQAIVPDTVSPEYFDVPDDMDLPEGAMEMAEGGSVEKRYKNFKQLSGYEGGDTDPDNTGYELVTYVNANGRKIFVVEVNGVPQSNVPEGYIRSGEEVEEDEVEDETTPEQPQPRQQPEQDRTTSADNNEDPLQGTGASITTGGYIADGKVHGGTQWTPSYSLDGSVTLTNATHGTVTLSKEEAVEVLSVTGSDGKTKKGPGLNLASNIMGMAGNLLDRDGAYKARQKNLSSGSANNPAFGNSVHKDLIAKAAAQKVGKDFITQTNSTKGILGNTKSDSSVADAVAKALGKTSGDLTPSDFQILGSVLSNANIPGAAGSGASVKVNGQQVDPTVASKLSAVINEFVGGSAAPNLNSLNPADAAAASGGGITSVIRDPLVEAGRTDSSSSDGSSTTSSQSTSPMLDPLVESGRGLVTYQGSSQNDGSTTTTQPVYQPTYPQGGPRADPPSSSSDGTISDSLTSYNNPNDTAGDQTPQTVDDGFSGGYDNNPNSGPDNYDSFSGYADFRYEGGLINKPKKKKKTKQMKRGGLASR